MGSIRSEALAPWWAIIEDSTEDILMTSSREGCFGLPSFRRCGMGAPPTPVTTTSWLKDILNITAAQQAESSLQRQAEASVSSLWDTSSNQLSHIPNSIFFESIHMSCSYFFLSTFVAYIPSISRHVR
jgi:hypothetical protein